MTLLERIQTNLRQRKLVRIKEPILVGVSGGVDSIVLLNVLHALGIPLFVAHFNHQLRGVASERDERFVQKAAENLGLRCITARGDVRREAKSSGESVEMAGRRWRHQFLADTAVKTKVKTVAVAHHADDQVELFFLRLLRGTSVEGLAGMRWTSPSPADPKIRLIRPLLNISKEELLNYAKATDLNYREDATNLSNDFLRNRVRNKLIPYLTRDFQPSIATHVLRLMDIAREESDLVAEVEDYTSKPFGKLPVALQRRRLSRQLLAHDVLPSYDLIERLLATEGQWIEVEARRFLRRTALGTIELREQRATASKPEPHILKLARKGGVMFSGVKVSWQIADNSKAYRGVNSPGMERYDAGRVGKSVWLRHWQPGDRFQPIGMHAPKKLQDLFTDLKVPRTDRHQRLIGTTADGEIFWVEGLRMAEKFKLTDATEKQLNWSWSRPVNRASS